MGGALWPHSAHYRSPLSQQTGAVEPDPLLGDGVCRKLAAASRVPCHAEKATPVAHPRVAGFCISRRRGRPLHLRHENGEITRPNRVGDSLEDWLQSAVMLFLWCTLYFSIKQWQQAMRERQRLVRAESEVREARLTALRYQLN